MTNTHEIGYDHSKVAMLLLILKNVYIHIILKTHAPNIEIIIGAMEYPNPLIAEMRISITATDHRNGMTILKRRIPHWMTSGLLLNNDNAGTFMIQIKIHAKTEKIKPKIIQ